VVWAFSLLTYCPLLQAEHDTPRRRGGFEPLEARLRAGLGVAIAWLGE
jgi:hypothetical protein